MLAYYSDDGSWIIAAAIFTVFAVVVAILVGIFGVTAFKASLRSFFLTELYDFETRKPWPPGTGKHSYSGIFPDPYTYVSRQEVAEDLRASQTMQLRREDVRVHIIRESRCVSYDWDADFQHLKNVRSCLKNVKHEVKRLKESENQSLTTEYKPVQSSSEFDKTFHIEELIELSALTQVDFRAFVESLLENHQGNITEVEKKIRELAEDLQITCLDKDKAHDVAEEYLDELFMCHICTHHDENTPTERLEENIERLYELLSLSPVETKSVENLLTWQTS